MDTNLNEVVRENVDNALEQADEFLQRAAETTGDEAKELQEKAKKCLLRARGGMKTFFEKSGAESKQIAGEVNDCVHDNPWRAVGIAAVGGLLLGLLIARK